MKQQIQYYDQIKDLQNVNKCFQLLSQTQPCAPNSFDYIYDLIKYQVSIY